MDQSLTSEKLNFLHSLLDKELEGLKESSLSNSGMKLGNLLDNQFKSQQITKVGINTQQEKGIKSQSSSFHLNSSLNNQRDPLPLTPLESSLNISRQNHIRSNSQTPIKDESSHLYKQYNSNQVVSNNDNRNKSGQQFYYEINQQHQTERDSYPQNKHNSNHQEATKNIRMSQDLQELQNKIMNLEKKIISINNPQQEDKENSYLYQESDITEKQIHSKDLIEHSFSKNRIPTYDRHETTIEDDYLRKDKSKNDMFDTFNTFQQNNQSGVEMINTKKVVRYNSQQEQQQMNISQEEMVHDQRQTQKNTRKSVKQQSQKNIEANSNDDDEDERDEDTPMKRKYKNKQKIHLSQNEYNTSRFNTESSESGQAGNKSRSLKRGHSSSASHLSNNNASVKRDNSHKRANKFQLEKKIQEAEGVLNNSKNSIKRSLSRNNSLNRNNSLKNIQSQGSQVQINNTNSASKRMSSGSNANRNTKNIDQVIANHNEVQILNKKIMQLKKQSDQDRQLIIKERLRNNEMAEEIEKQNRKMKKMANQIEKYTALDEDYKKLMQSFEKSEYIRQQQKQLITNLKNELDYYKKNFQPSHTQQSNHHISQDSNQNEKKRNKSKSKHIVQ